LNRVRRPCNDHVRDGEWEERLRLTSLVAAGSNPKCGLARFLAFVASRTLLFSVCAGVRLLKCTLLLSKSYKSVIALS
jgi:hypothetical protein